MEYCHIKKKKRNTFRRERSTLVHITLDNVWCADRVENDDFGKIEATGDAIQTVFGPCEVSYLVTYELEFKINSIWKKLWFVLWDEQINLTTEVLR